MVNFSSHLSYLFISLSRYLDSHPCLTMLTIVVSEFRCYNSWCTNGYEIGTYVYGSELGGDTTPETAPRCRSKYCARRRMRYVGRYQLDPLVKPAVDRFNNISNFWPRDQEPLYHESTMAQRRLATRLDCFNTLPPETYRSTSRTLKAISCGGEIKTILCPHYRQTTCMDYGDPLDLCKSPPGVFIFQL